MAEALEAARANTQTAVSAAVQHRHRGERSTPPQHITDLADLVEAMSTIHGVAADLAAVAKSCADNVRARYFHGSTPTGGDWPQPLKDAAADADRALTKLRQHLNKATPARGSHDALSVLHGFLRDVHRAPARSTT
jgi:hypothetical protein